MMPASIPPTTDHAAPRKTPIPAVSTNEPSPRDGRVARPVGDPPANTVVRRRDIAVTVQVLSSAQVVGAAAPVPTAGTTILGVELADEARARQDAELLPGSDSFVQVVMGATAGCGSARR